MSASKHLPVKTKLLVDNISPPWEARTDFDAFSMIAAELSRLAAAHLGTRTDVIAAPLMHDTSDELAQPGAIDDERLRLIFTCCHPALAMQTRVAATLRMVAGLTVAEIARAFLVQETTVGRRITRAKAKIKAARSCRPSPPGHHSKRIAAPLRSAWIRS